MDETRDSQQEKGAEEVDTILVKRNMVSLERDALMTKDSAVCSMGIQGSSFERPQLCQTPLCQRVSTSQERVSGS